ncbi:MAG TPA: UDP-3-O-(3-hydroxymyristoyl)glucosamine N-acyltransferase [Bryobacteraceae bacterium]|nr:UDP-3-O-(3-hydroxymyristoyl)glucosamine N-acyltransferase [Bryobacteraceae bacterium]
MRVDEIARRLSAVFEGAGDLEIAGAATLESAGPREVAFVGNRKAAAQAAESRAGCLLVTGEFPAGRTLIRVADPRGSFATVIGLLYPPPPLKPGIHPSAVIAPDARIASSAVVGAHASIGAGASIGERTSIGAGCCIGAGVRIGADGVLHARVTIYDHVGIGDRAILHSGCVLGADGFGFVRGPNGYQKFPQIGRVEIGDDVEIGANSCIDRAALGVTRIGDGVKLDNLVHIAHNCSIGRHVVIAAQTGLSGGVVVEDYAVIGGQVGIGDKARIETGAVLGSGCGILTSKIVRKGQVVWGTPARPLKEYLEQLANLARLPKLRKEVAGIEQQLRGRLDPRENG